MTAPTIVDTYLADLRAALGPMTLDTREEIVREIAAHIRDSADEYGDDASSVIARLGPAEELAAEYRDGLLIRRASRSISPITLLRASARLATKGISGVVVFFVGMFGYLIGGGLVLSALLKPVFPANTGVWFQDGRMISSGTQLFPPPPPAHEVLGMWYVPLMLVLGSLTLLVTSTIIRISLRVSKRWQLRLGRLSHAG